MEPRRRGAVQTKDGKVSKMTRTNNNGNQAKHMNQNVARGSHKRKAAVVALAIAGVLAVGGVSAVCVAGLGKSPGQAPVAAQTTTAQKATPEKAVTPAKAEAKQAEAKQEEKPAQQQAQPAQQQAQAQPAKAEAKPAQQAQPAKQQAQPAQQQVKPQAEQAPGMEAKVSREQCIAIACAHVGAGAAKGEAMNVSARGPVDGGGTIYYVVELDLGDVHYSVTVDATSGHVINADQTHAGTRTLLGSEGNPVEGTEWQVSA